jgi:aldehyde:ferredoxin oxidoreductase
VVELDGMLNDYYQRMGWDANGIPTRSQLTKLGLDVLLPKGLDWMKVK